MLFSKIIIGLNVFIATFSTATPKIVIDHNNDNVINAAYDDKSYLENKNFVRSDTAGEGEQTSGLNIESSYPTTDLKWIFSKGSDDWRSFNLETLKPKNGEDASFKFILGKPVNDNFYLYIYTNDSLNYDFSSLYAEVSTSITLDGEEIIEQYTQKQARFVNSVGYFSRFSKWSLDGIVSSDSINRIKFKNITLSTKKGLQSYIFDKKVEDEIFWNSQDDFTYQYWANDVISVKDAHIVANLEGKYNLDIYHEPANAPGTHYRAFNEFFYYFFNLDKDMSSYGDLEKVDYTCQYFTHVGWNHVNKSSYRTADIGKMSNDDYTKNANQFECYHRVNKNKDLLRLGYDSDFELVESSSQFLNLTSEYHLATYTTSYYSAWFFNIVSTKNYTRPNIIELRYIDDYEIDSNSRKFFKNNFDNWKDDRGQVVKTSYAFDISDGIREELGNNAMLRETIGSKALVNNPVSYFAWHNYCPAIGLNLIHWVSQVQIFRLTFKNDISNKIAFDVYDVPRDVDSIVVNVVDRPTLVDDIVRSFKNFWSSVGNALKNILPNILPLVLAVVAIVLLIVFYPLISSFIQGTSQVIRTKADIKQRRLMDKEKERAESKTKRKKVNKNKDG